MPSRTIVQRCEERGVRLTAKRRALASAFENDGAPIDIEEAWGRVSATVPGISRSSLYRLVADLVSSGVLVELPGRTRRRYVAPDVSQVRIISDGTSVDVEAASLSQAILAAATEAGLDIEGRRIVIHLDSD